MTNRREPLDCPGSENLLKHCAACGTQINTVSQPYVVIYPSWHRCNDVLCRECWQLIMTSAELVIRATQDGAVLWVQEPFGTAVEARDWRDKPRRRS